MWCLCCSVTEHLHDLSSEVMGSVELILELGLGYGIGGSLHKLPHHRCPWKEALRCGSSYAHYPFALLAHPTHPASIPCLQPCFNRVCTECHALAALVSRWQTHAPPSSPLPAAVFNQFYTECQVNGSPEEDSRLLLAEATALTMRTCFQLLGIHVLYRI